MYFKIEVDDNPWGGGGGEAYTLSVRQGVIDTQTEDHTQTAVTLVPLVTRPRAQRVQQPIGIADCSMKSPTRPRLPLGRCILMKSSTVRKY